MEKDNENKQNIFTNSSLKEAYFAGGCFWCIEGIFDAQEGVIEVIAGYLGGTEETATYEKVSTGQTSHREGVKVVYNPNIISYKKLVELFWRQIDPTDEGGQFADRGYQYTTVIYFSNEEEQDIASKSKDNLVNSGMFDKPIATKILPFTTFFSAEAYHQDYYKKNPVKYNLYAKGSGREDYKKNFWGNDSLKNDRELKNILSPMQYKVTQEGGTEPPFDNEYWNNHKEGIYVDVIDGTPLFSSTDKFDSGTGWPSFTKPIDNNLISELEDNSFFIPRTEVKHQDSHLGHVFKDGPNELGGLRYCINSSALRFIPKENLEKEGYSKYLSLF